MTEPQNVNCRATVTFSGFNQVFVSEHSAEAPALLPTDLTRAFTSFVYHGLGDYLLTLHWQVLFSTGGLSGNWTFANAPISEWYDYYANTCNLTIFTDTTTTNSDGKFADQYGNVNAVNNPIPACQTLPNCGTSTRQSIQVLNDVFSHLVAWSCAGVNVDR